MGYMESALTQMRDDVVAEQYKKLYPLINDALKKIKELSNNDEIKK
jgi:hypothetical protein